MGKKYCQLSLEERCTIAHLSANGQSLRQIATSLDRAASTIAREVRRNGNRSKRGYQPAYADEQAWARRWRGSRLERHPALQHFVLDRLAMGWSPEQVAGRMALEQHSKRISHESIYRFIYTQYARSKDGRWRLYLPRAKFKRGWRQRRGGTTAIPQRVGIAQRPAAVLNRQTFGHWEADLLLLSDKKHNVLVMQERKSRYAFLHWQTGKHAIPTVNAQIASLAPLPKRFRKSITFDNGTEFSAHTQLHQNAQMKTFFCDPASPWQKGGVENLNGRLRRFLPRKTDPASITPTDIQLLQQIINTTPRKCLGFFTPLEVFSNPLHFKLEFTSRFSPG